MATADLHGDDDEFAESRQFRGERLVDSWIAQTLQADSTKVSQRRLEEYGNIVKPGMPLWRVGPLQ